MSSVSIRDAYALGGAEPRGVSTRYSVPLDGKPISLGPFPFTPRSLSIVNQTGTNIVVTDDRGEQYVAQPSTEVTYGVGPTLRLSAQTSSAQTSGKATVVVFDTPQPVSSSQLANLTPQAATLQIAKNGALVGTEPTLDFVDQTGAKFSVTNDAPNNSVHVSLPASPVRQTNRIPGVVVANTTAESALFNVPIAPGALVANGFVRITCLGSVLNGTGVARDYPRLKMYAWSSGAPVIALDTGSIGAGAGIPSGGFQVFKLVLELWTSGSGSAFGYATMLLNGTCAGGAAHTNGSFVTGTGEWDVFGSKVYAMGSNASVAVDNSIGFQIQLNVNNFIADPSYEISFDTGTVEIAGF